jgi:murein DD-endopeptidase MepM/ murein hydrolase activator NlpD
MWLNIAPLQPFNPPLPVGGPYVLHEPSGYMSGVGFLVLDAAMRLAARSGGCSTVASGDGKVQTFRYSLKLEFKKGDAASFTVIAPDLTASDDPVALPASALPTQADPVVVGILRATAQGQACIGFAPKGLCSSTVKVLSTDEFPVLLFQRGALAAATYATRFFDLEDWDTTGFRVAEVLSLTVHPFVSSGASVGFDAEGYSASGAPTIEHITLPGNPFFAIRQSDFVGPGILFPVASEGTDQRSGLRWPRAVGYRNGHPFWYTATLPDVVRDVVGFCNPGPRSFYRLPWTDGLQVGVGQGNNSAFSHTGSQAFAFDVSLTDGQTIRAIRGGTVEWFQESQTAVFNPNQPPSPTNQPFPNGSLQNWGNAVRIAHQDGTFAWYFHIKTNGVTVNLDEEVQRGQPIAQADNTGRSSGAHLHFQVQADNINWGQSIQIRFDTPNLGGCYIPQTGDSLISNNSNPNF